MRLFYLLVSGLLLSAPTFGQLDLSVTAYGLGRTADTGDCHPSGGQTDCRLLLGTHEFSVGGAEGVSGFFTLENSGTETIVALQLEDYDAVSGLPVTSGRGVGYQNRSLSLSAKESVELPVFFSSPDALGVYKRSVQVTAIDARGGTTQRKVDYTLTVVSPSVEITSVQMGPSLDYPACDPSVLGPCPGLPSGPIVTVGAGEEVTAVVTVKNAGESLVTILQLTDYNVGSNTVNAGGAGASYFNSAAYFDAGNTYWLRSAFSAPAAPGTYERRIGVIAQDAAGNTATYTVAYTLVVTAPRVEITEVRMGRAADNPACDPTVLGACTGLATGPVFTIGAGEELVATVAVRNSGEGMLTALQLIDYAQDGTPNPAGTGVSYFNDDLYMPGGTTYWLRSAFTAPVAPGTYERRIGVIAQDVAGNLATYTVAYTLVVTAPQIKIADFGLGRSTVYPACEPGNATACVPLLGEAEVRAAAGERVTATFLVENTGASPIRGLRTLDRAVPGYTVVAEENGIFIDLTTYQLEPATTGWQTVTFTAPVQPGTYEHDVLVTARDLAGNAATARFAYTLIVEPPRVSIPDYGIGRAADSGLCTEEGSAGYTSCSPLFGQHAITATGGETISAFLTVRNDGLARLQELSLVDYVTGSSPLTVTEGGIAYRNAAFNQPSGASYGIFVSFTAPSEPGLHARTVILRAWDAGGNIVSTYFTYTIEVVAPDIRALEYGIGLTRGTTCQEGGDIRPCSFASATQQLSAGPGEPLVLYAKYSNGSPLELAYSAATNGLTGETFVERALPLQQGETVQAADHFNAPTEPGTYAFDLILTGRDAAGNEDRVAVPIELTVTESRIGIDKFGVGRVAGTTCFEGGDPRDCAFLNGSTSVELPAGETFGLSLSYTNGGEGSLYNGSVTLFPEEEIFSSGPAEIAPGDNVNATAFFAAPSLPGVYDYRIDITAKDAAGSRVARSVPFTVHVKGPSVRFDALGIGVVRDAACRYGGDLRECFDLDGTTSLEAAPGEEIGMLIRYENNGLAPITEGTIENEASGARFTSTDLQPGETSMVTDFFLAPAAPGTYLYAVRIRGRDEFGNPATAEETVKLTVRCDLGDYVSPTAVCADATLTVTAGDETVVDADVLDTGSSDNCTLAGIFLAEGRRTYTCSDAGTYPLTLVAVDGHGNTAECKANLTVTVSSDVYGANGKQCATEKIDLNGQTGWTALRINGRTVAEIELGTDNELLAGVQVSVAEGESLTDRIGGVPTLGKRVGLDFYDAAGDIVSPKAPVGVRLFYLEEELDALLAAGRAASIDQLVLLKSDDAPCDRETPAALTEMAVVSGKSGCQGENPYLEFQTTSFSTFTLFSASPALPVELLSFTAYRAASHVLLTWETATETGNDFFAVERSGQDDGFTEIGRVTGGGTTRAPRRYDFVDTDPLPGRAYYRLRQVDLDGTIAYGPVRTVLFEAPNHPTVFPNPVARELSIAGFAGGTVSIWNSQGTRVREEELAGGQKLAVGDLPAGHYTLRYIRSGQVGSLSFIKL